MKRILFLLLLAIVAASASASQKEGAPAANKGPAGASGGNVPNPVIDENGLVTLTGNTRPEAKAANDRGAVPDSFRLEHMMLQLRRTPQQEQAVEQFIAQLHDPKSPNFRHWLSAEEFGTEFGLPPEKLDVITEWLSTHGFVVNVVYPNHMVIDFSGNAGLIRREFHTELHYLEVKGERHYANMSDPKIPAMLAPMVAGIVSLHDFKAYPQFARANPRVDPDFTTTGGSYAVAPADLATIYNFNQLFNAGVTGAGQTVVVVEDSDVAHPADFDTFRSVFDLSGYSGASFTTIHPAPPSGTNNCSDPGNTGSEGEAALDVEMVTSAAPSAAVVLASCADTGTTFGFFTATQNLINSATPPPIISMSYGVPESDLGSSANAAINSAYQQGAGEGVSIFVSSGDQSASGDRFATGGEPAVHGININGFGSTPYNVSVGATDFSDTYAGTNSTYWKSTNTSTYGSAISYIPEIPMSSSCANVLVADYAGYKGIAYGTSGFCNISEALNDNLVGTWGTSGGPSGCATGTPTVGNSTGNVVSGTCAGYAKPSWQSVLGNPSDGVRDIPDISLFGAVSVSVSNVWNHSYVICDTGTGTSGCPGTDPNSWTFIGGTSAATPVVAGLQADLLQTSGVLWGNMAPYYYSLASTEYGATGNSACDSNLGSTVGSDCIFYDVTPISLLYGGSGTGSDMDVPCTTSVTTNNCYKPSGTYGVLSLSTTSYEPAYTTTTGWDFATGIGTPNAYNLVAALSPPTVSLSPPSVGFGGQAIGTSSAAKYVSLTNTNLGTLNLTSFSISGGDNADFLLSQSCPGTLAFGASCPLRVTFKPTGPGPRRAGVSISDNAGGSPQTVILTGVGTGLSLTPTSLIFSSQTVGTSSAPTSITLFNAGSATMHIWEIAIAGANAGDFSKTTTCAGTLGAGASCTVSVTFEPTATGARNASVLFSDDGGGSPQAVPVKGTGT